MIVMYCISKEELVDDETVKCGKHDNSIITREKIFDINFDHKGDELVTIITDSKNVLIGGKLVQIGF